MTPRRKPKPEEIADAAKFDAMVKARPLKPPPIPRFVGRLRSAGELALAREIRAGMHDIRALWVLGR